DRTTKIPATTYIVDLLAIHWPIAPDLKSGLEPSGKSGGYRHHRENDAGRAGRRASSFVPQGDCDSPKFICHILIKFDTSGKPLRTAPNTELLAGTIIQGTPYVATYNNSDGAFYLQGFYGNPYNIPLGAGLDYWGPTTPNSSFVFPTGQAISRTTYAALFSLFGTTYGGGDGSTTFNLPDKTGRVSAMKEASSSRLTLTYFGGNSANLGPTGGGESIALSLAQLPTGITSSGSNSITVTSNVAGILSGGSFQQFVGGSVNSIQNGTIGAVTSTGVNSISVTSNNTGGNAHRTVPPTIICNYIIRIL